MEKPLPDKKQAGPLPAEAEAGFFEGLIFVQNGMGMVAVDPKDLSYRANPEALRILGLQQEEIAEEIQRMFKVGKWDPDFPFSLKNAAALPSGETRQVQIFRSGSEPVYALVNRQELKHPEGSKILFLTLKDVSNEVRKEKSLLENKLKSIEAGKTFSGGNLVLIHKDLTIEFAEGTDFETDLPGKIPGAGEKVSEQYGPHFAEYILTCLAEAFNGLSQNFELNIAGKTYAIIMAPIPGPGGQIESVLKVSRNISDEKKAGLEAHYRREYLRQILDTDPNLIYVQNKEGKVLMANKSAALFFNTGLADFIENASEYLRTYKWKYEETQALEESIFKTLKTLTTEEAIFNRETGRMHLFQMTRTPFVTEGNQLSILCVGVDITDRINAENELINQREYLRHILDTDPNLIFVKDYSGKFKLVNRAFAEFYNTLPEAITGKTDAVLNLKEDDIAYFRKSDSEVIARNEAITTQGFTISPATGKAAYFVTTKKPLLDVDGNLNILGVVTDITIQKNQEEKVRKSEELLQEIFNRVADALFLIRQETLEIVDCNQKSAELLAIPEGRKALTGSSIEVVEVKSPKGKSFWREYFQKPNHQALEIEIQNQAGAKIWGSLAANRFSVDEKGLILLRIADITIQKITEEQIKQNLHEKEILIQEIHHRVKNNMAVIYSLLQLQSGYIKDPALVNVFRDSQSRIKSMALIHEKLYQSNTLAKVEMESYIRELARTLLSTYNSRNADIRINIQVEEVFLDINSAVPCGLIINEVISNACKHAFTGRDKGNIDIVFEKKGEQFHLVVKDDGVGMPDNTDFSKLKSLGMNLVQALASQLGATLEIKTLNGVSFSIVFTEKVKPVR